MALKKWALQEWQTQWPLVRFEIYKYAAVAIGATVIGVAAKVLYTLLGVADLYFYGGLLIVCCLVLYFVTNRLKHPTVATTDQVQAIRATPATVSTKAPLYALLVLCFASGIWNFALQHRVRHLEAEMRRFVLPRELTKQQIDAFGKYLASNSTPHEARVKYILGDTESLRYAEDISSAFRAGNWLASPAPINPLAITCHTSPPGSTDPVTCRSELDQMVNSLEGVAIRQTGPNPPQPSTIDEKLHPRPYLSQTISGALKAAGIDGGVNVSYSNSSTDPLDTITVFVGFRPRDKWGVLPAKFYARQPGSSLQDLTDDDF